MATPAPRVALACLVMFLFAAPAASAYPGSIPAYNNTVAPTLANGQEPALPKTPAAGTGQTPASTSRCRKAKRSLKAARRKLKRYKRKFKRARRSARRRVLRRKVRRAKKAVKRAKKRARARCAAKATALPHVSASETNAYHRAEIVECADGGHISLYGGPDMRSQSPSYAQGVAHRTALFKWNGSRWVFATQFGQYWWTTVGYSNPPFSWIDGDGYTVYNDQGFTVYAAGYYRIAVRYHWFPNAGGGRTATAWHWAGAHSVHGTVQQYCTYG